ncbi:OmpA family protein [Cupriavidus sp. KK10]|jgi:outer membrane protein OmpA-like peptidoglycan-associated protein|uniref:OmpA family protein n=1 Tax=Cupriavidus sp. KK10 TaxID=1478019 RepID=UPI001BA58370|nr:OmpA family protein [Cupriavidus sp. KK10]QUN27193.1 OmpA family protein [Cupriavidus sp. KK10]
MPERPTLPCWKSLWKLWVAAIVLTGLSLAGCQTAPPATGLSPAQVAVLKQEGFALTDEGWELGLSDKLLFGFNEDLIDAERAANVQRLGRALKGAGIERLRVDGHTDEAGSAEYNQSLSVRRAEAVARLLAGAGFAPESIEVRGRGKSRPVADNRTAAGRAENRRVAIVVSVD